MTNARVTHVLLDFFGTLVDYSPSRVGQGYRRTHALAGSLGVDLPYGEFLAETDAEFARFDARSQLANREFSMQEMMEALLSRLLGRAPAPDRVTALVDSYIAEWNGGVVYPATTAPVINALASQFRLAVVTNTHQADLVPSHLTALGIAARFDLVVTSVELGWRKPHPRIYAETLRRLGIAAPQAIFVGDTFTADYAGPRAAGIAALLLDPAGRADIPAEHRLDSLTELPAALTRFVKKGAE